MARRGGGGGGAIPAVVEGTVKRLMKKAPKRAPSGSKVPTVEFEYTKAPAIGKNYDAAVRDGLPTDNLNRATEAQKRANRRAALRGQQRPPKGQSLDEFPFASSTQGGAGSRVAPVPVGEQNYQGGVLSSFYQKHGVQPGDPYNVRFT